MAYTNSQAVAGRSWSLSIGPQAPSGLSATGSGTGGTLAAATYYYKVTAIVSGTESLASAEVNVTTTGTTSSVALAWSAVSGAASYKIYRGTSAGAESVYQTSATNSFTDAGAAGTAGTPPATSGTLIGEIQELPFERPEWQFDDITNLQSGNDEEILPTIRKGTEFTLKVNYVSGDAGQTAVENAYANATLNTFTLQATKSPTQTVSGDKWVVNAYVLAFNLDAISAAKHVTGSIKVKTTGPCVKTLGS